MMVGVDVRVRSALLTDQRQIANLMHFSPTIHRHLDWRYPLDWIGSPPFFVLEQQGQIISALACPPDPPTVAWVRLFVNSGQLPLEQSWRLLWEAARLDLAHKQGFTVAAIVLQDWYHSLLINSGFISRQSIVMLERDGRAPVDVALPSGFSIRSMLQYDLPAVAEVDARRLRTSLAEFPPISGKSLPTGRSGNGGSGGWAGARIPAQHPQPARGASSQAGGPA